MVVVPAAGFEPAAFCSGAITAQRCAHPRKPALRRRSA
jgi:hypothetical protein